VALIPWGMLLPLFPLDVVAFPGMTVPLYVFEARYRRLVRWALEQDAQRFVIVLVRPHGADADDAPLHAVGTVMDMVRVEERQDGTFEVIAHAQERVAVEIGEREDVPEPDGSMRPLYFTPYSPLPLAREDPNEERIAAWDALEAFRRYAAAEFAEGAQSQIDANLPDDPLYQASLVCANLRVPNASRQVLLEAPSLVARFRLAQKLIDERLASQPADDDT
jgi:uncharacterized protein